MRRTLVVLSGLTLLTAVARPASAASPPKPKVPPPATAAHPPKPVVPPAPPHPAPKFTMPTPPFTYTRQAGPARTEVTDATGAWVATLTDGARTATLTCPARTFTEPTTTISIDSTTCVRIMAAPFAGTVDPSWLTTELADSSPDLLAMAMQYEKGAPDIYDKGLKVAGPTGYGIGCPGPSCHDFADFNDYLGIDWKYAPSPGLPAGYTRPADPAQRGNADCSGFLRTLAYRSGIPLAWVPDGSGLARRAKEMFAASFGVTTKPNSGAQASPDGLNPGDLVFFDAYKTEIDHAGIYLGQDRAGHQRFISSRQTFGGVTFGDVGGASTLDGTGYWAAAFRAAKRL